MMTRPARLSLAPVPRSRFIDTNVLDHLTFEENEFTGHGRRRYLSSVLKDYSVARA
jgi:hypothetical protein